MQARGVLARCGRVGGCMGLIPCSLELYEFVGQRQGKRCCSQLDTEKKLGKGFLAGTNGKLHHGGCASIWTRTGQSLDIPHRRRPSRALFVQPVRRLHRVCLLQAYAPPRLHFPPPKLKNTLRRREAGRKKERKKENPSPVQSKKLFPTIVYKWEGRHCRLRPRPGAPQPRLKHSPGWR